ELISMLLFYPYTTLFRSCRLVVLLEVEGGGDLDFLALDRRLGEGHPDVAVLRGAQQRTGAVKHRPRIEGLRRRHRRYLDNATPRSEEHTSELQSRENLVC